MNYLYLHDLDTQIKLAFRQGMLADYKFLIKDKNFPTLFESINQITPDIKVIEFKVSKQYEKNIPELKTHLENKYPMFSVALLYNRITMYLK